MNSFTMKDYKDYLENKLVHSIYKLLPLYEEQNKFLCERIDSLLNFELFGLSETIGDLPKDAWYGETINTLKGLEKRLRESEDFRVPSTFNKKKVRREILKLTNLIEKQVRDLNENNNVKEG